MDDLFSKSRNQGLGPHPNGRDFFSSLMGEAKERGLAQCPGLGLAPAAMNRSHSRQAAEADVFNAEIPSNHGCQDSRSRPKPRPTQLLQSCENDNASCRVKEWTDKINTTRLKEKLCPQYDLPLRTQCACIHQRGWTASTFARRAVLQPGHSNSTNSFWLSAKWLHNFSFVLQSLVTSFFLHLLCKVFRVFNARLRAAGVA